MNGRSCAGVIDWISFPRSWLQISAGDVLLLQCALNFSMTGARIVPQGPSTLVRAPVSSPISTISR